MISGIEKDRNWLKIAENVAKIRPISTGTRWSPPTRIGSEDGREDDRSDHPHEDSGLTQERAHVFHLEIRDDGSPIECPTFTNS